MKTILVGLGIQLAGLAIGCLGWIWGNSQGSEVYGLPFAFVGLLTLLSGAFIMHRGAQTP